MISCYHKRVQPDRLGLVDKVEQGKAGCGLVLQGTSDNNFP